MAATSVKIASGLGGSTRLLKLRRPAAAATAARRFSGVVRAAAEESSKVAERLPGELLLPGEAAARAVQWRRRSARSQAAVIPAVFSAACASHPLPPPRPALSTHAARSRAGGPVAGVGQHSGGGARAGRVGGHRRYEHYRHCEPKKRGGGLFASAPCVAVAAARLWVRSSTHGLRSPRSRPPPPPRRLRRSRRRARR